MNIKLNVNGSLLTRESAQYAWVEGAIEIEKRKSLKLSQYTWGVDFLEFEFDEAWDDYAKFAMFVQNEQVVKVEIEDYKALIPTQFTGAIEPIKLMVYGRGEGQITTNTLQLTIVTTLDPDTPAGEPTQGLFYIQTENVSQLRINEAGTGLEFKDGEIWKGFPDLSPLLTRLDTLEADNAKLKAYQNRKWEYLGNYQLNNLSEGERTFNCLTEWGSLFSQIKMTVLLPPAPYRLFTVAAGRTGYYTYHARFAFDTTEWRQYRGKIDIEKGRFEQHPVFVTTAPTIESAISGWVFIASDIVGNIGPDNPNHPQSKDDTLRNITFSQGDYPEGSEIWLWGLKHIPIP